MPSLFCKALVTHQTRGLLVIVASTLVLQSAHAQNGSSFLDFEPAVEEQTVYYTSPKGDDNNSGLSQSKAFATLQHAADVVQPGDTVLVMKGNYSRPGIGGTVMFVSNAGTPDNWITFKAFPGHRPCIKVGQNWGGITVGGASYVMLEGLTVQGERKNLSLEDALEQKNNPNNPTMSGNGISITRGFEDPTRMPHHIIVRDCSVFDCPGGGIETQYADYIRFEGNHSQNNAWYSPYANSGISIFKNVSFDDSMAAKIIVRNNVSEGNRNYIPNFYSHSDPANRRISDGNGIIIDDGKNEQHADLPPYIGTTLVIDNVVFENGGKGIVVYNAQNVVVTGNDSKHNAQTSTMLHDFSVNNSSDVVVMDNRIEPLANKLPMELERNVNLTLGGNVIVEADEAVETSQGGSNSGGSNVVADTGAPTVAMTTPSANHVPVNGAITGTASDDSGVAAVEMVIYNEQLQTWNGNAFTTTYSVMNASLSNPNATSTNWSYNGNLPDGAYTMRAWAFDTAGKRTNTYWRAFHVGNDTAAPAVNITTPATNGDEFTETLSGTATDDHAIKTVELVIYNAQNQTWNGSNFTSAYDRVQATLSNPGGMSTNWSYNFNPPAEGTYTLRAIAADGANRRTNSLWRIFVVEDE